MLAGVGFGLIMGLFYSAILETSFFVMFIIGTLLFGLLFFGGMALVTNSLSKKTFEKIRQDVAMKTHIYFEGAANIFGKGGCLFVTENGIEHHPHKENFDVSKTIIPHDAVISIEKIAKNKLCIKTAQASHTFVVDNIDMWMELLYQNKLTKNKIYNK